MAKLETIFDHGVTDSEFLNLFSALESKDNYLKHHTDPDTEFGLIFDLYMLRSDLKKANEYLSKVKDPLYRFNLRNVDTI